MRTGILLILGLLAEVVKKSLGVSLGLNIDQFKFVMALIVFAFILSVLKDIKDLAE